MGWRGILKVCLVLWHFNCCCVQCVSPEDADVLVQNPGVLQMHPQVCLSVGLHEIFFFFFFGEAASLHRDPFKSLTPCDWNWT